MTSLRAIALLLIVLWGVSPLATYGQAPIVFEQGEERQRIGTKVFVLEDTSGKLQVEDVRSDQLQARFEKYDKPVFTSTATRSAYWFRIEVLNQSEEELWLDIGDPYSTWEAQFYPISPETGQVQADSLVLGALHPEQPHLFPSNYYCVPLGKVGSSNTQVYYLRVSGAFPKNHALQIGTYGGLVKYHQRHEYLLAGFIGLLIAMIVYNAFLAISLRSKLYLFYVFYLAILLFEVPFNLGYPLVEQKWMWEYTYLWRNIDIIFVNLFTVHYLDIRKRAPKLYFTLWFVTLGITIGFALGNLLGVDMVSLVKVYQLLFMSYGFLLLGSGVYIWAKGMRTARFYVLAWAFTIFAILLHIFTINGLLPLNLFTKNIVLFGFGLETLFFALALGDRFNSLKREKDLAQKKNLELVQKQNTLLEQKVEERTYEIQQKQEEILTQNEELRQTQEELQAQRDFLSLSNNELEAHKNRIEQNIQAAKLIQKAILPTERKFEELFASHFLIYLPADVVSGDFYWLSKEGEKIIVIEADCTGHGVSGAFTTFIGKAILDQIIRIEGIHRPDKVLERTHRLFQQALQQKETGDRQGMDLSMLVLSPQDQGWQVQAGGSGQKIYLRPPGEEMQVRRTSRKRIGGVRQSGMQFEFEEFFLPSGTDIYLLSDGFADQHDKKRRKFGSARLMKRLQEIQPMPFSQQKEELLQTLKKHQGREHQRDDITLMGLRLD